MLIAVLTLLIFLGTAAGAIVGFAAGHGVGYHKGVAQEMAKRGHEFGEPPK